MIEPINLSPSFLSKLYDRGYDYAVGEKLGLFPSASTTSMSEGRAIHAMIADALGDAPAKIAINKYDSFKTKEARDWRDSQPDDTAILTERRYSELLAIVRRIIAHPAIKPFLGASVTPERIVEKRVGEYNVKGIVDFVSKSPDATVVIDWKFVSGINFDNFEKKALHMHYDLQAAVYDFLVEPTHVYFCVIESEPPFRIKLLWCDPSFLESGSKKFDKAFQVVKAAQWRDPCFDIVEVGELMSWENLR